MGVGVSGSLFETFVHAVRAAYADDDTVPDIEADSWQIGRLKGMGQVAAPSIKFSRPGGVTQPTTRPGPHTIEVDGGPDQFMCSKYEDLANVEARISATSWGQLECIRTGLLAASRNALGTLSVPGTFDHISEGDDDPMPDFVKGNQLLVQTFVWRILVPHSIGTLTEINTILGTSQFIDINDPPGTAGPSTTQT